jgi:dihydroorotate dehydrogenase electron transfer subunit
MFEQVRRGKHESNVRLPEATLTERADEFFAGSADVLVLNGSADTVLRSEIPPASVDYILTDPPHGGDVHYLALSTFWGAWLQQRFDYANEIVVAPGRGKAKDEYFRRIGDVARAAACALKPGRFSHFFFHDVQGPYFPGFVRALWRGGFSPERVIHQPPTESFSSAAREKQAQGHIGDYVLRAKLSENSCGETDAPSPDTLLRTLTTLVRHTLQIRGGKARTRSVLQSVYQGLAGNDILRIATDTETDWVSRAISRFVRVDGERLALPNSSISNGDGRGLREQIRSALLDAYSMLADEQNSKNQIWQLVFRRFENDRLSFDDIREVDNDISRDEILLYRQRRYQDLLCGLGQLLGFEVPSSGVRSDTVAWRRDGAVACQFSGLRSDRLAVKLPNGCSNPQEVDQFGTIEYKDIERFLWNWSRARPDVKRAIGACLNPMDLYPDDFDPSARRTANDASVREWQILSNTKVCTNHFLMELQVGEELDLTPGQFFQILCDGPDGIADGRGASSSQPPLALRRPLSAHRIHHAGIDRASLAKKNPLPYDLIERVRNRRVKQVDFLYKTVGAGTTRLSQMRKGDYLNLIGPIGRGFSVGKQRRAVIVAGGVGIAPLMALAEWLRYLDIEVRVYLGVLLPEHLGMAIRRDKRSESAVALGYADGSPGFAELIKNEFAEIGVNKVWPCVEKETGRRVTDDLAKHVKAGTLWRTDVCFYACGPIPMMRETSRIAADLGAECQVLLEERMACGLGACLSCVCTLRTEDRNTKFARVCLDGPVFEGGHVLWPT